MEREQKTTLIRILLAAAILLLAAVCARRLDLPWWGELVFYLIPYLLIGYDVLWRAARNIAHGQVFDERFLMSLATLGAFAIGEYPEGVFVMVFYQLGEWFQDLAVDHSRRSIADLMDLRPDGASVERNGTVETASPEEVAVGEVILLRPGERVPLDGVILEGSSALDTAALTGEPLPREVSAGEDVISGCVNLTGALRVRVTRPYGQSTVAKILDLVEHAGSKKARAENFITKFSRYYTPAVVALAAAVAVIPPLLGLGAWSHWLRQGLTFLVISCPCALVISVPLAFFGGMGGASKAGILVKGGCYLETLARAKTVIFDKTGTLTQGVFNVTAIHPQECDERQLLELAALSEGYSHHPIARSLREAWGEELDLGRVSEVTEAAGRGVRARVDGEMVYVGNSKLMEEVGVSWHPCHKTGATVHVARSGEYLGHIVISDALKPGAPQAIAALAALGVEKTVMLTGDAPQVGEAVGAELGISQVHAGLLPGEKVEWAERLLAEKPPRSSLVFVGDGINDAPVLSRVDVGIAMGAMGSDAAIEAADVVLMDDKPSKVALAIRIARRTVTIARENIVLALGVKAAILTLGVLGHASLWLASFADVGVAVLAVLNALRCLKPPTL